MNYRKCVICGFKSGRAHGQKRFFMARFPLDETQCKKWVKIIGQEDLAYVPIEKLHELKFVCGRHFKPQDFKKKKTRLKFTAVPSLKLTNPPLSEEVLSGFPCHVFSATKKPNVSVDSHIPSAEIFCEVETSECVDSNIQPTQIFLEVETSECVSNSHIPPAEIFLEVETSECIGTHIPPAEFFLEVATSECDERSQTLLHTTVSKKTSQEETSNNRKNKSVVAKAKNPKQKENLPQLPLTPRKRKLIKKIQKFKLMVKQFRQKVKVLDKIKSTALKTLLNSAIKNQTRKLQGKRWSNEMKGLMLTIYKKSPKVYRYLRQFMPMPSERTLQSILQKVPMEPGLNKTVITYLEKKAVNMTPKEKICVVVFDEMSIKKRLIYNPRTDKVEGYVDLGSHGRTGELADKTLVFMLQGIHKKFKQPLAHYFVKGTISSAKLSILIKDVIKSVSAAGFHVIATVCDQGPTNVGALSLLKKFSVPSAQNNYFIVEEKKIYIIFDVPHLFKSIRNNFMQAGQLIFDGKKARWSHLREVSERNSSTLHFKKITPLHVDPSYRTKMKVKLAAQILSNTVKAILMLMANAYTTEEENDGTLKGQAVMQTANVVEQLDKLFDCTNGPASRKDIKKGIRENVTKNSFHHKLWKEFKNKIQSLVFLKSDSQIRLRNIRCLNGYNTTLCSLEDIWKTVEGMGFKYLNLRQLNQDSLENLFGIIRQHCPTNQNPTCSHFTAALKSTILTRLNTPSRGSNCESDQNELMLDFHELVFKNSEAQDSLDNEHDYDASCSTRVHEDSVVANMLHIPDDEEEVWMEHNFDAFEKQPTVYVSGWIASRLIKHAQCSECVNCLRTNSPHNEDIYKFIALCEWWDKKSLTYPTIKLCSTVDAAVKVFEEEVAHCMHLQDIGQYCRTMMMAKISDQWICEIHRSDVFEQLIFHISLLLIRNECKKINKSINETEQLCADYVKKAQVQGSAK